MSKIVRTEKRRKGIFGWFFAILFWGFHAMMGIWVYAAISATKEQAAATTSSAEEIGTAIGATIGFGLILVLWAIGTIILGALAYFTRGKLISIEETVA